MSGRPGMKRNQRVLVLYTDEEFEVLRQKFSRSTSRSYSHYVRRVSLDEPVGIVVHNGSFDAFIDEIVVVRKAMQEILRQGQWSPANQERLVELHQELKSVIDKIAELCMRQ